MRSLLVILTEPSIDILLQFVKRPIDLSPKGHPVELIEHGLVESLADAVSLRMSGPRPGVVDVLQVKIELVLMMFSGPAVLCSPVGENAQ